MTADPHQLAFELKRRATAEGFDLCGIAPAAASAYRDYFRHWLDDGQAGTMGWLSARFDERTDPAAYMPGAQSVICVAMNYHVTLQGEDVTAATADSDGTALTPAPSHGEREKATLTPAWVERGKIARYALGDDYHELLKQRLHRLADWLRGAADPPPVTKCAVDTAPLMEKELAARAGIGWVGKNNCLIHPRIGSWLFLGEIVTTLALPPDDPLVDRCGTCTRCLDACPTGALTAPYQLDARRCISYLTIEHRDDIGPDLAANLSGWLYGCDICQDVCPWNGRAPSSTEPALQPRFPTGSVDLHAVLQWRQSDYSTHLRHSAMKRVKLPVLQRSAARLLGKKG